MANLRILRDVFVDATVTATSEATGSGATWYATNLINPARDRSHRTTNLSGQSVTFHWNGQTRDFDAVHFGRHKLHGAKARVRYWTDQAATVPATGGDPDGSLGSLVATQIALPGAQTWGLDSSDKRNVDLGYYRPTNAIPRWLASRLTGIKAVTVDYIGTPEQFGTSLAYYQANRIVGGKYQEFVVNVSQDGLDRAVKTLTSASRSGGGSNRRVQGEQYRALTFDQNWVDPNDLPLLIDLLEDLDQAKSFLISFYPTSGGRIERDYTFVGTFSGDMSIGARTPWPISKSRLLFVED